MSANDKTCHVVFQTHWDREWYLPFETFRHRFMHVMERIMDGMEKGEINQFVLDGQMAAIEDYFDVCSPSQKQRVLKLLSEKRLIIGPWYVLADEFLVSGESLWRNLEIGMEMAREYGEPQSIGYLPDTFGHISQMPQILQAFDIDNAILWRGINMDSSEFRWRSPNGEEVFTVFLPEGYYQPVLNEKEATSALRSFIEKVEPYTNTSHVLLTNGGDHLMPSWENMNEKIEAANKAGLDVIPSTYEHFMDSVRKESSDLPTYVGEMRSNEHIYVLPNVLSTRTYLKKQNQEIEDELTRYVEPMLTLADAPHLERYLTDTWKLLLQNHPHDSICGCSIDEVHKEMETRTMRLRQRMDVLKKEAMYRVGAQDLSMTGSAVRKPFSDMETFTVFNPHAYTYDGWVQGEIWLYEDSEIIVETRDGMQLETVILKKEKGRHFDSPTDAFPEFKEAWHYQVAFLVQELPALSMQTFSIRREGEREVQSEQKTRVENEFLKIEFSGNELVVTDLPTGEVFKGMNRFTTSMDAGDEYNYSPPVNDVLTEGVCIGAPEVHRHGSIQELRYVISLDAPASLNQERTGPVDQRAETLIDVSIRLFKNDPIAQVSLHVENHVQDQRLRVGFPLQQNIQESYSDTAFDVIERIAQKEESFEAEKQKEVPVVVEPSASFVYANRFSFVHRGLQEYQVTEKDEIAVTLIRSVGWLSRDDLRARGGGAGPSFETPDAQCQGLQRFEYGFGFQDEPVEALYQADRFRRTPLIQQGNKTIPSLIEFSNPYVQVSAIRQKHDYVEVRVWNPMEDTLHTNVRTDHDLFYKGEKQGEKFIIPSKTIQTFQLFRT